MGFCLAPRDFNDCYSPVVKKWVEADDNGASRLLSAACPVMGSEVNLSVVTSMDDIAKMSVWEGALTAYGVCAELNHTTRRLEDTLLDGNWRLSPAKTGPLLTIMGPGSNEVTRQARHKKSGLLGESGRELRVLGPYLHSTGNMGGEIARIIVAVRRAWRQGGPFWASDSPRE
eukprot:1406049-Pyramimonas_sp.AAC.1